MIKLIPLLLSLLLMTGCGETGEKLGYRQISMNEAVTLMEEEVDYILLDVRTAEEFRKQRIPGAINIPNEVIGSKEWPQLPDKKKLILVYCRSGNRSKQASAKLAEQGYSNIVEIGGIMNWPGQTVSGR